jgi:tRNA pseudouridine38-40 synthase
MVRNLVGTLLEVSAGRRGGGEMAAILDARDRRAAGVTAPPEGLTLVRVLYPAALLGRVEGPDCLC